MPHTVTRWLSPQEVAQVLEAYRIPVAAQVEAVDPDTAVTAAKTLGYPVALKAAVDTVLHKSDNGGVVLDLAGPTRSVQRSASWPTRSGRP